MEIQDKIMLSIAGIFVTLLGLLTYNVMSNPSVQDEVNIVCRVES